MESAANYQHTINTTNTVDDANAAIGGAAYTGQHTHNAARQSVGVDGRYLPGIFRRRDDGLFDGDDCYQR